MKIRRVNLVVEQPDRKRSKARLYGYGIQALAVIRGVTVWTVKRDVARGRVDLGSLVSVVKYVNNGNG